MRGLSENEAVQNCQHNERLADEALSNYRGNFSTVEGPENLEILDRATEAVRKVLNREKE